MFSDLVEEAMEIFMDSHLTLELFVKFGISTLAVPRQESNFKLGKMSFHGNRGYCLGTQDFYSWIGSRPSKSCPHKNSLATYNSQGDKKFPMTCWFLQKVHKRLLKNL